LFIGLKKNMRELKKKKFKGINSGRIRKKGEKRNRKIKKKKNKKKIFFFFFFLLEKLFY
jgi:hypothetical protein